jgi:hypothetical protein
MATSIYWTDTDSGEVVTVVFDAITALTPEDTVDITEHPVEEGANVTDHARSQAGRLTIECVVSMVPNIDLDTDIGLEVVHLSPVNVMKPGAPQTVTLDIPSPPIQLSESGLLQAGIGALTGLLSGAPKAKLNGIAIPSLATQDVKLLQQDSPRNRVRDIYQKLLLVKDQHALITVLTLHRDHFDMMIERIADPRTAADGSSAKFQIDLKEIRTVSSQQVQAPKPSEPRAAAPKAGGSKNVTPDPDPAPKVSLAEQFAGSLSHLGL